MKLTNTGLRRLAAALLLGALCRVATATPVIIPDFSFEKEILADGTTGGVGTNWVASGNGGFYTLNSTDTDFLGTTGDTNSLPAPADGTNCFVIGLSHPGYCWQDLGLLQSNTTYTLTVAIGASLVTPGGVGQIALVNGVNAFGKILATTTVDSSVLVPGTFADSTLVFTTGQHVSGHLTVLLEGDYGTQIIFDNVRLDATPTPNLASALPVTASPGTNVFIGTTVTLSEDPAGLAPFHYHWWSDNGTGSTFTAIPGATAATYAVNTSAFSPGLGVQYQVVVTNSLGSSTSAPVLITATEGAPILVRDILPTTGSDMVGSSMTFTALMDGTRPLSFQWQADTGSGAVNIPNATNATLTLSNLQLTDSGTYYLVASNALGITYSSGSIFYVNDTPTPTNNVDVYVATQLGFGGATFFTPTWSLPATNLISGLSPSSVGVGSFSLGASGTPPVLTDGSAGAFVPAGNGSLDLVTCGTVGSGAGSTITYTLPASSTGYDLTNITVFGGWSDAGRDQQRYAVLYSTVASPTNFNQLVSVNFNPTNPASAQSATRATIVAPDGSAMAKNVAALKFDFSVLDQGVENGFAGYSEIEVFGVRSAPAPVVSQNTIPVTGSDVVGSSVTFVAAFGSSTPVTYQWRVDRGSGPVPIPGATNTTLTLTNLQLSDTASPGYSLQAVNSSGSATTSASSFVVNPLPAPDGNGIIAAPANQTGSGSTFTPTWTITPGSLIAGQLPTGQSTGNFALEGAGGLPVLTDGQFGFVGSGNNSTMATAGSGGVGKTITYTLTGSASGYDITNIVTYGGWSDGGRDKQAYTVSYSTVANPTVFTQLTSASYNPALPGSVPTTDRVTLFASAGGAFVSNVSRIMFDFSTPAGENGYQGYAELAVFGTPSAAITIPPVVSVDTLPITAADVVGSSVTYVAVIAGNSPISYQWQKDTGTGPVNVPGANGPTLTLSNLQLSDSATPGYSLIASNALGVATTTPRPLTVNPAPTPANSLVTSIATQTGTGIDTFSPTWKVSAGSLISGLAPSAVGTGNFSADSGSGKVAVLTDGKFGNINPPGLGSPSMVTCGTGAGGQSVTYTLPANANGYSLSNIVIYGGWSDAGRDQQHYTISYSTAANPGTFVTLGSVNYNPSLPGTVQSAVRVTITPASAPFLASSVSQLRVNFTNPTGENGYSGYGEIDLFGVATPAPHPTINAPYAANGNLILAGTGGTPGTGYTWLSTTNLNNPLAAWSTNSTGVFDSSGAFSNAVPITATSAALFYSLRIP